MSYLAVDKKFLGTGLSPIDILILAQIQEFERSNKCFVTNQQFAEWFGVSTKTVERSLSRLEELQYINRDTKTINDNGQKSKQRIISSKGTVKMSDASNKVPSKCSEGTVNLSKSNRQNDAIKDNLKKNKKITLESKREISDLSDDEGNDICNRLKRNESYISLSDKYNLPRGSITKDFPKQWQEIIKNRTYWTQYEFEKNRQRNEPHIDYDKLYAASKHNLDNKENELDLEEIMNDMFM